MNSKTRIRWYFLIFAVVLISIEIYLWKADFSTLSSLTQARQIAIIFGILYFLIAGAWQYSFSELGIQISVAGYPIKLIPWHQVCQVGATIRKKQPPILLITKVRCKRFVPNHSLFLYELLHPFGVMKIDYEENILSFIKPFYPNLDYVVNEGSSLC